MRSLAAALLFVLLTVVCWGNYGPLMHEGNVAMGDALRPFVGVGFAYFLIAVVVPGILLGVTGEQGVWTASGAAYSLLAGLVPAVGALAVIMAFNFKGSPVYVMPLVFGGAPVVNTLVTMGMTGSFGKVNKIFLLGVLAVALGAAGVLSFRPSPPKPAAAHGAPASAETKIDALQEPGRNYFAIYASVAVAVLCWGSYGPMLHKGQMKMNGSRLRPFLCVGVAYFLIAVALPLILIPVVGSTGTWTGEGIAWSLAGGAAGAIGSLGIIMAFNFGGKPIFVMPLVFGFAPVMNTITTLTENGTWGEVDVYFVGSLAVVIAGAVTVLVFAPKPGPPKPAAPTDTSAAEPRLHAAGGPNA